MSGAGASQSPSPPGSPRRGGGGKVEAPLGWGHALEPGGVPPDWAVLSGGTVLSSAPSPAALAAAAARGASPPGSPRGAALAPAGDARAAAPSSPRASSPPSSPPSSPRNRLAPSVPLDWPVTTAVPARLPAAAAPKPSPGLWKSTLPLGWENRHVPPSAGSLHRDASLPLPVAVPAIPLPLAPAAAAAAAAAAHERARSARADSSMVVGTALPSSLWSNRFNAVPPELQVLGASSSSSSSSSSSTMQSSSSSSPPPAKSPGGAARAAAAAASDAATAADDAQTLEAHIVPGLLVATRVHFYFGDDEVDDGSMDASELAGLEAVVGFARAALDSYAPSVAVAIGRCRRSTAARLTELLAPLGGRAWAIHVRPWGRFVPALNALLLSARERGFPLVLYQSLEVKPSAQVARVVSRLAGTHVRGDDALVAGAALGESHDFGPPGVARVISGACSPWNTLAVWRVDKLALTGFLLVSEDLEAAGVEEVAAISLLQRLLPRRAAARLVAFADAPEWDRGFGGDPWRQAYHRDKMRSKVERAARQLEALGLDPGIVHHVDDSQFVVQTLMAIAESQSGLPRE